LGLFRVPVSMKSCCRRRCASLETFAVTTALLRPGPFWIRVPDAFGFSNAICVDKFRGRSFLPWAPIGNVLRGTSLYFPPDGCFQLRVMRNWSGLGAAFVRYVRAVWTPDRGRWMARLISPAGPHVGAGILWSHEVPGLFAPLPRCVSKSPFPRPAVPRYRGPPQRWGGCPEVWLSAAGGAPPPTGICSLPPGGAHRGRGRRLFGLPGIFPPGATGRWCCLLMAPGAMIALVLSRPPCDPPFVF